MCFKYRDPTYTCTDVCLLWIYCLPYIACQYYYMHVPITIVVCCFFKLALASMFRAYKCSKRSLLSSIRNALHWHRKASRLYLKRQFVLYSHPPTRPLGRRDQCATSCKLSYYRNLIITDIPTYTADVLAWSIYSFCLMFRCNWNAWCRYKKLKWTTWEAL